MTKLATPIAAPSLSKGPEILTFGCRLNAYESEVMRDHARAGAMNDAVIVNTCAVTGEAVRQARQAIRKARRERPDAEIIVTGCAAQIEPASFAEMPEVTRVIGNDEKMRASSFSPRRNSRVDVGDIMSVTTVQPNVIDGLERRARAYVQVQNGCDHRCTFCIIPFGRGNSRSVPIADVVQQIARLVERGHNEVVLTGVDLTSYGPDLGADVTLGALCKAILHDVPELPRLRLSSIDSIEVDDALFDLIAHERRLMPHLHLSLQSGDDMILKRMKRRHSRAQSIEFCDRVRHARPDIAFGADLIAGFPTETDGMFENSLQLIEDCGLTFLHVFPYSPRPGTPAERMPQVDGAVIKSRAARLRSAGEARLTAFLGSQIGKTEQVLVERPGFGRTPSFAQVQLSAPQAQGAVVSARITAASGTHLNGEVPA